MNTRILIAVLYSALISLFTVSAQAGQRTRVYNLGNYPHEDMWYGSGAHTEGVHDGTLRIGTWFETCTTLMWFDISRFVDNPQSVALWLYEVPQFGGYGISPANFDIWRLTNYWDEGNAGYYTTFYGYFFSRVQTGGVRKGWIPFDLTNAYKHWKQNPGSNQGILLQLGDWSINHYEFASCEYKRKALRPRLQIIYDPGDVPMKLPLPGGQSWLVTTQVGGLQNDGGTDKNHTDGTNNYWSIDFAPTGAQSNVEVKASAGGKVIFSGFNTDRKKNGYYVVIDHDYDGKPETGILTMYLHLDDQQPLNYKKGDWVAQGDVLGIMGNTGLSTGVHLHFEVKYGVNSLSTNSTLQNILLEGRRLSDYQVRQSYSSSNY
jgi:hypothetical protein